MVAPDGRLEILGCPVDNYTMQEAMAVMAAAIASRMPMQVVPINAAKLWRMNQDPRLDAIVRGAGLIVPEKAIVMGCRFLGTPLKAHIGGVMLLKEFLPLAAAEGFRIYFLGARPAVVSEMVTRLAQQYPALQIAGYHDGYFSSQDEAALLEQIRAARPDVLVVAMGTPKQEYWIAGHMAALQVPVCIGVGGSFDVLAGIKQDAPPWVRRLAVEWLYRLAQDPRNLWKRYLTTIPWFLMQVGREKLRTALSSEERARPRAAADQPAPGRAGSSVEEMPSNALFPPAPLAPRRPLYEASKRTADLLLSVGLLVLLWPLLALIALAIKLTSPGPVLYRWQVVGKGGIPFTGYKFRTMVVNADELKAKLLAANEMSGPVFKMKHDPRITQVGRVLRKLSLDELPQLWSVVRGDMSLVGPRPPLRSEYLQFEPWQRAKLGVLPGITCLWQIGGRNRVSDFDQWVRLDLKYIERRSLVYDLWILVKTIPAVLLSRGAY